MPSVIPINVDKLTLLGLIQQACGELGIRQPSQIFGAVDNQTVQLLALAKREGKDLYQRDLRKGGWEEFRQQNVFQLNGATGFTGNTIAGSTVVTNITPNPNTIIITNPADTPYAISCQNIPNDTHVAVQNSSTQVTLDTAAAITGTNVAMSFGQDGYALPTDFSYYMTTTTWDRSFRWQMLGPLDAQEWQVLKSGISPTGPRRRFRIMGNYWYVDPMPTAAETIVYEYYSNAWTQDSTGELHSSWEADSDFFNLDDDAFILGIKWRWKAAKGLDYTQEKRDYDLHVERLMARNAAERDLPLNAQASGIRLLNEQNVPDTGFGS